MDKPEYVVDMLAEVLAELLCGLDLTDGKPVWQMRTQIRNAPNKYSEAMATLVDIYELGLIDGRTNRECVSEQ